MQSLTIAMCKIMLSCYVAVIIMATQTRLRNYLLAGRIVSVFYRFVVSANVRYLTANNQLSISHVMRSQSEHYVLNQSK